MLLNSTLPRLGSLSFLYTFECSQMWMWDCLSKPAQDTGNSFSHFLCVWPCHPSDDGWLGFLVCLISWVGDDSNGGTVLFYIYTRGGVRRVGAGYLCSPLTLEPLIASTLPLLFLISCSFHLTCWLPSSHPFSPLASRDINTTRCAQSLVSLPRCIHVVSVLSST